MSFDNIARRLRRLRTSVDFTETLDIRREMFPRYDPWSSFPQVPVSDLHMGDGHEDLDLDIIFDDSFLRPTARPTAPSASPAPRAAQDPSHMPSQEPVDAQVHSSAPVDPSPLVQIDPSPPPATAPGSAQETVEEPAKEPSDQPSQEAVDTHVHSSAPMVQSPSIESSPQAPNEATQVSTAAVSHRKHIFTPSLQKGRKNDHDINHPVIKRRREDSDDSEGGGVRRILRP
ncbi:uncharacterized protein LOC132053915 [Lycium ferocissimum]|uniref:uncharacterized protein LOC132053915 n=1 Tax=Lycium ferocissimum TaxID=112874 RepID=UPI00281529EA|nr:uncharacterized protein LOC132053915 [Lycium ferocissimum]